MYLYGWLTHYHDVLLCSHNVFTKKSFIHKTLLVSSFEVLTRKAYIQISTYQGFILAMTSSMSWRISSTIKQYMIN